MKATVSKTKTSLEVNGYKFRARGYIGGTCMNTMEADSKSREQTVELLADCFNLCAAKISKLSPQEREWIRDGRIKFVLCR